jgi:amino acid adenylation domain-containing protein
MTPTDDPTAQGAPDFDPFAGPAIAATAPSTEPQREIWTATLVDDKATLAYNESLSIELEGSLDLDALRASYRDLLQRHEALRTTVSRDGTSLVVLAELPSEIEVQDLSEHAPAEREIMLDRLLVREVRNPMNLEDGPLARASLCRLSSSRHVLVFTAHHIVCDGYSAGIIVRDWARLYTMRLRALAPNLPKADSFTAYARGLKELAACPAYAEHERFWLERFAGEIPVLDLPTDRPRPPVKTFDSRRIDVWLDDDLIRELKRVFAKQRASLFVTLLAGFGSLMARLSGQQDIVVGVPAAGQNIGGHDSLVGHCVNMLPVRAAYDPSLPFDQVLSSVRTAMLDAFEHQEYTFGSLLKKLPIARDPSRLPIVSVVFNVDRGLTPDQVQFEGLRAEVSVNPRHFENFDLFLNGVEMGGKLKLECQYNTDLFDADTVRRWLACYENLLRSMVAAPAGVLGDLDLLTPGDKQLLAAWNDTAVEVPGEVCVHHLIEAQVARTPDAAAISFEGTGISYRDLDARANRLARKLRALGVRRDMPVGLCLERSIDMIVAMLAVHKAGGGYVPLDPGYPRDRVAFMVDDAAISVLVTDSRLQADLGLQAPHVVCIVTASAELAELPAEPLEADEAAASPRSLAYVIYTSGSTGKPKGVLVEHACVVNLLATLPPLVGMTGSDVVLAITTLSFDIAVSELLMPLTVGARIALVSRDTAADGTRLMAAMQSEAVTFVDATPATYRLLLAAGWEGGKQLTLICTGEAMPRDLAQELVGRAKRLWNGYGPTETTVWSTFHEVAPGVERILIGRPVANTQIRIVDGRGTLVPVGVTGEILIGGAGVARGYLNRPEITQDRFVPDRFRDVPGARLYRTGDLGRYLADGTIECVGRNDSQVKLRGYRIELGEIENCLSTHAQVRQVAVVVREDRPGDRRLLAYLVPDSEVTDGQLRAHVKAKLPDYMVPQHFVRLEKMPLTPSGKINRKALPAPTELGSIDDREFVEPRTECEQVVAQLWMEALVLPRVSVHDDFFALGGHSLLASQVLARLRRDHGIVLPFRKMFEAPTIEQFAKLLETSKNQGEPAAPVNIARRKGTGPAPLSMAQERIRLLEEMEPGKKLVHNLPAAWRLVGDLDVERLKVALQTLAQRHETLRTGIRLHDGKYMQFIEPECEVPVAFVDLEPLAPEARNEAMVQYFHERVMEEFDLARPPLFRTALLRFSATDHVLFTLRHNIIWDGWSFDIFVRDLSEIYEGLRTGRPPKLPDLPISYADYAEHNRAWIKGPEAKKQLEYWTKQLQDPPPPLDLPLDLRREDMSGTVGGNQELSISREMADAIASLGRSCGGTLYTVVLAAYAVLLSRTSGQDDFIIGSPVRARMFPETEEIIGPFVNTVALRMRVDPSRSFTDLVARVRDLTLDAFSNQELPLEALEVGAPITNALFSLQDARTRPSAIGDLKLEQIHATQRAAMSQIMLWLMDTPTRLLVVMNFNAEAFEPGTMQRFLEEYHTILQTVVADPKQPVGKLDILPPGQKVAIAAFGKGAAVGGLVGSPVALMTQHAKQRPDALAICSGDRSLTYGELVRAVSHAASSLDKQAIGRGSRVGLLAGRSIEARVATLALLQRGATCVALEPSDPDARLAAIVSRAELSMIWVDAEGAQRAEHASLGLDVSKLVRIEVITEGEANVEAAAADEDIAWMGHATDDAGEPQPSATSHGAILHAVRAVADAWNLEAGSRVANAGAPGTLDAVLADLAAFASGATVIAPSDPQGPSPDRLGVWLDQVRAPAVFTTTSQLHALFAAKGALPVGCKVLTADRPMGNELRNKLLADPKARVVNAFALREGDAWSMVHTVTAQQRDAALGHPVAGVEVRVLDVRGATCTFGSTGDVVWVKRDGSVQPTGVRARLRATGVFSFAGLRRGETFLAGRRARLEAVRAVLQAHPAVREAVVVARDRSDRDPRLVAYFVPERGVSYTETDLRKHVRAKLPRFMVPAGFVEVSAIERLADGEADPKKLPIPYEERERAPMPPRTDAQKMLAGLWKEFLEVQDVNLYDNFFGLGGHSLQCFQMIARVERATAVRLNPRFVLLDTLEQLAARIESSPSPSPSAPPPAPKPPTTSDPTGLAGRVLGKLRKLVK